MVSANNVLTLLEKLQSQHIAVHQDRCVVVRNRNASCRKCAEACTAGCLSVQDGELSIAPEKCIGCGTCATACPTCAIEIRKPDDAELYQACVSAMEAADGEAVLACDQILAAAKGLYDPSKVVGVKCLGRIDESLVAMLACSGATGVTLSRLHCETCSCSSGGMLSEEVCATAKVLLETWGSPVKVRIATKLPKKVRLSREGDYDAGRREFFANLKGEAVSVASVTTDYAVKDALGVAEEEPPKLVKVGKDGTLPHTVSGRRKRLATALSAMGKPQDVMIETRLWGHAIIDPDLCDSCRMCATFCPTGALRKFDEPNGDFGVDCFPGLCVKCGCCTDICLHGALRVSDEVFAMDLSSNAHERYAMKPRERELNSPHQIWHTMKNLIGCDQVYER